MSLGLIFVLALLVAFLAYFIWRMATGRSSRTTNKDWLVYFLIAPLMIGAFLGVFFYADGKGVNEETIFKWMNIFITAVFVFGFAVKKCWKYRKRWTFWAELSGLILAHFVILQRLHWREGNYSWLIMVIGFPELAVVLFILGLRFDLDGGPSSKSLA